MIVRPKPRVWELFGIWRLSIIPRIAPQIGTVLVFAAAVVLFERRWPVVFRTWTVAPFTLLGIALSIFLGFRNSACYDRWWEARRQLGALIGEQRSLARTLLSLPGGDRVRRRRCVRRVIGYTYALMAHLREGTLLGEGTGGEASWVGEWRDAAAHNVPDALLRELAAEVGAMLGEQEFAEQVYVSLDARLAAVAAIQVACERIRGTPTPFTYTLLLHRTAYAFCFLLPFGLAGTLGWATPVFCAVVAYAFFGLDALGDELEEPFGASVNALPLTAMARTVERSLLEALGETELPPAAVPIDSVLL